MGSGLCVLDTRRFVFYIWRYWVFEVSKGPSMFRGLSVLTYVFLCEAIFLLEGYKFIILGFVGYRRGREGSIQWNYEEDQIMQTIITQTGRILYDLVASLSCSGTLLIWIYNL